MWIIRTIKNIVISFKTSQFKENAYLFLNKALTFQVKGSVIIFNTDLQNVSFKNLRIIWGEQNACNHSVFISTNNNLKFVSMPKLRGRFDDVAYLSKKNLVINKKPIYIVKNPYMCYLNKINWQEVYSLKFRK